MWQWPQDKIIFKLLRSAFATSVSVCVRVQRNNSYGCCWWYMCLCTSWCKCFPVREKLCEYQLKDARTVRKCLLLLRIQLTVYISCCSFLLRLIRFRAHSSRVFVPSVAFAAGFSQYSHVWYTYMKFFRYINNEIRCSVYRGITISIEVSYVCVDPMYVTIFTDPDIFLNQ